MQGQPLCDLCGGKIVRETVSHVRITAPNSVTGEHPKKHPPGHWMAGLLGDGPSNRSSTDFEVCPECALGLLVALKDRQRQVYQTGKVEAH